MKHTLLAGLAALITATRGFQASDRFRGQVKSEVVEA
jgi:hypothetical protein